MRSWRDAARRSIARQQRQRKAWPLWSVLLNCIAEADDPAERAALLNDLERELRQPRSKRQTTGKTFGRKQTDAKAKAARVEYLRLHLIPKLGATAPDSPDALVTARALLAKVNMKQDRPTRLRQEIRDALKMPP